MAPKVKNWVETSLGVSFYHDEVFEKVKKKCDIKEKKKCASTAGESASGPVTLLSQMIQQTSSDTSTHTTHTHTLTHTKKQV